MIQRVSLRFASTLLLIVLVDCKRVRWLPSSMLSNPNNFVSGEASPECDGVYFPDELGEPAILNKLAAKRVYLPQNGIIEIMNGGFIWINPKENKCTIIKRLEQKEWSDPQNWRSAPNKAVPHDEQIPCDHDDVVFEEDYRNIPYPDYPIELKSFQLKQRNLTWIRLLYLYLSQNYEGTDEVYVGPQYKCTKTKGCTCHQYLRFGQLGVNCGLVRCAQPHCLDPIQLVGHCCPSCGGKILAKLRTNFNLQNFRAELPPKAADVDLHVSRVEFLDPYENQAIQISFADGGDEYEAASVDVARNFHAKLAADLKRYDLKSVQLSVSGQPYVPGHHAVPPGVVIIFATFCACVGTFVCIYLAYGPLEDARFTFKVPFDVRGAAGRLPLRFNRPVVFARFDNTREDGSLLFGDRSVVGSAVSLDKAFDNPLYGEPSVQDGSSGGRRNETMSSEDSDETEKQLPMQEATVYSEIDIGDAENVL